LDCRNSKPQLRSGAEARHRAEDLAPVYVMGHGRIVFQGEPADFGANSAMRKEWLEV
jgi:ABC-type branched-subunit amino acid transport system ATPase component